MAVLPRSGLTVEVQTLRRHEIRWGAPTPESFTSVPNKVSLNFEGFPAWAEIVVVRLLERSGWGSAWVKNWGGCAFWRDVKTRSIAPNTKRAVSTGVTLTGARGGCWDIVAWRDDDAMFIESKQRRRDRLRPTQRIWLETAMGCGCHYWLSLSSNGTQKPRNGSQAVVIALAPSWEAWLSPLANSLCGPSLA